MPRISSLRQGRSVALAGALLSLLAFSGCGGDGAGPAAPVDDAGDSTPQDSSADGALPDGAPVETGPTCSTKADCAVGVCDPVSHTCVGCLVSPDSCAADQYCDVASRTCLAGCHDDSGCAAGADAGTGRCDLAKHACVACIDDTTCPLGTVCADGACVTGCGTSSSRCAIGESCCGGACVDVLASGSNCGACGNDCSTAGPTGSACVAGACACPGDFGATCGGKCADLGKDDANCGTCGTTCAAGTKCTAGAQPLPAQCAPVCMSDVVAITVPTANVELARDPAWSNVVAVTGATSKGGGVVLDAAAAKVAALVLAVPTVGADAAAESTRVEGILKTTYGAALTAVTVGTKLNTHEGHPGVTSRYALTVAASNASAQRDRLVNPLLGVAAPGGQTAGAGTAFLVEITTVRRATGPAAGTTDVYLAIGIRAEYEAPTATTLAGFRGFDLTNGTAVHASGAARGAECQLMSGAQAPKADILWTVDTSGSMGTYQDMIGRAGKSVFDKLLLAGVDFRMGVMLAGHAAPNLATPGFKWIAGTDAAGPGMLCRQVTSAACSVAGVTDSPNLTPYAMTGSTEEPVAAAVNAHYEFYRRAKAGETNVEYKLRPGSRFVSFFVTDEPGSNDFSRYFASTQDPQLAKAWGTTYTEATLSNIVDYFSRNQIITLGLVPVSATAKCTGAVTVADLPRCVVDLNGGVTIPISTASATVEASIVAAFSKVIDELGANLSPYRLAKVPISSMIRVEVAGSVAPRSRVDGWDWDPATNAIFFYGSANRPKFGDAIVVTYRTWN